MYDYIKQLKWAKLKVGIVVTLALLVLFFTVMFAGNIEKLFVPRVKIYAMFDDVKGLREGSPVWLLGVEIGSVKSITFTPRQKIQVAMSVSSGALTYLKKDSMANILTLGLLGDKYVEINPGSQAAGGLKSGDTITGTTQIEIQDIVETGQESIAGLSDFISMLEEILVKIEKGEGTVSKFLKDPSVYDNLKRTTEDLSKLVKKVESGKGSISSLLNDDTLYRDVASSAEDIRHFTGTLKTSEGTLNRLIEDESLYENVNAISEKVNNLLERIERGEGFMGSMVKDDELSKELKTTLRELNSLITDIKKNPRKYFKFSIF